MAHLLSIGQGRRGDYDDPDPAAAQESLRVAPGLLMTASPDDLLELAMTYRALAPELRCAAHSNLTILCCSSRAPGCQTPSPSGLASSICCDGSRRARRIARDR